MFRSLIKTQKFTPRPTFKYQTRSYSISKFNFQTQKTIIDDDFDPEKLKKQVLEMQEKIKSEQESKNLDKQVNEAIEKEEAEFKEKIEFTTEAKTGKFQTETAKLLNIVAESLYSDSQVFIREFVANASDAIEKARLGAEMDKNYLIKIKTNKTDNTITFEDNGIGMNESEVEELLGTIAKSGSEKFKKLAEAESEKSIIGQFGVGFYSSFMVGDKVEVYTKKHGEENGVYWVSNGLEDFSTRTVKNIDQGTKIVITLKPKHREYADSARVFEILEKFSSFSRHQISLDGAIIDMKQPIWNLMPNEIDDKMYFDFYKFIDSTDENPRYHLNYRTELPLSIKSIFYVPVGRPSMYEVQKEDNDNGKSRISLYSRNVLIQKNSALLPGWLRFVRGVVDCEDIPLNLSRELLQDEALIKKLQKQLTTRIVKWFTDKAKRNDKSYQEFFNDYKIFIIQGMLDPDMASEKDKMFKLLRYETSALPKGETTSLHDYKARTKQNGVNQTEIVYLYAQNRHQAESSSYYEILKSKGYEVLFCYDTYDDLAMANLNNFDGAPIQSAESIIDSKFPNQPTTDLNKGEFEQIEKLCSWACNEMAGKCQTVEVNKQLDKQPAMINSQNLSLLRYMFRQQKMAQATNDSQDMDEAYKNLLKLQLNPVHPLVKFAADEYENNPEKSKKVLKHLMNWSLSSAGLFDDSKALLDDTNELLMEIIDGQSSGEAVESQEGNARSVSDL